jgi:hypothetical protein
MLFQYIGYKEDMRLYVCDSPMAYRTPMINDLKTGMKCYLYMTRLSDTWQPGPLLLRLSFPYSARTKAAPKSTQYLLTYANQCYSVGGKAPKPGRIATSLTLGPQWAFSKACQSSGGRFVCEEQLIHHSQLSNHVNDLSVSLFIGLFHKSLGPTPSECIDKGRPASCSDVKPLETQAAANKVHPWM